MSENQPTRPDGMFSMETCPRWNDDGESEDVLVYIEHFEKPSLNRFVVGHFVEDGFMMSSGDELNYDYSPTMWFPLPKPVIKKD